MKKAVFILAIIVFSILYYMGVMTKKETLPFSKDFFTVETPSAERPVDIKEVWPVKGRSSGQKVPTLSSKELDQLYQLKLDGGLRNIPVVSFFLIREAQQARHAGDHDLSVRLANSSIKFSPDLFPPYFELAKARWHQNAFQLDKIMPSFLDGLIALTSYFSSSLNFYYNLFYILANAILLTFMLFGIVVLVKYFPLFVYDIRKDLSQEVTKVVLNGLKIFILFIPFFLRLDMLWAILYWNVLLWGYLPKKERQFLVCPSIGILFLGGSLFGHCAGDEQGKLRRLGWDHRTETANVADGSSRGPGGSFYPGADGKKAGPV
jgi:hypothetical protein